jgi:hypothetical protein
MDDPAASPGSSNAVTRLRRCVPPVPLLHSLTNNNSSLNTYLGNLQEHQRCAGCKGCTGEGDDGSSSSCLIAIRAIA